MATKNIQLSAKTLSSSIDSGIVDVNAYIVDSEGTTRYVSSSLSLSKTRKAGPILFILSTPRSQTVTATSVGTQIGTFSDLSVTIYQIYNGITTILTLTGLSATSPDLTGIATNPATGVVTLNSQTLAAGTSSTTVTITATATDAEGTIRSIDDTVSLSKIAKGAPILQLSVNPAVQSVTAKSTGQQQQSFSDVYATVSEIYNNIVSDKTILTLTATSPDISSISTVPAIGLISISGRTLGNTISATSASVGATVFDSEGTQRTLSGSFSLSKINIQPPSLQLIINPASQAVVAKSTGQQSGSFSDVVVAVQETYTGSTSFRTISTLTAVSTDIPSIVTNPSTGVITLSDRILSASISAASASVGATITDSEGTPVTLSGSISLAKVKNARPPIIFTVTPAVQNLAATASGSFVGGLIIDPIVCGSEGYIPFTYASHSANLSGTGEFRITGVNAPTMTLVYQQPPTSVVNVTGLNSTINTGIVTMSFVDFEGTPGTASIAFQINKSIAGRQQTVFTISPQSQTVAATSTGILTGPITNPTISASYGTASFTYASHSSNISGYGEFRIVGVTAAGLTIENSRPANSVINITSMSVTSSIGYVTMSFVDFDGGFGTASIAFQITKALGGRPNVQFIISPSAQTISATSTGTLTGPIVNPFVSASSGTGSLSYTSGTPTTGQYKIIGITSGGLTITSPTPTTPVINVTAVTANSGSAYVTASYVDFEGSPGTASLYFQITKALAGPPIVQFTVNPQNQSITATSTGVLTGTIINPTVSASSGTASLMYNPGTPTSGQYKIIGMTSGGILISSSVPNTPVINITGFAAGANSGSAWITASYVDFEGTPATQSFLITANKTLSGRPAILFTINPQTQTVTAYSNGTLTGTITDPVVSASSGTASFAYNSGTPTTGQYKIIGITSRSLVISSPTPATPAIDITSITGNSGSAYVTASFVDFEGTPGTASLYFEINKALGGRPTTTFIVAPSVQSVEASSDGTLIGTIVDPVISGSSGTASFTYFSGSLALSGSGEFRIVGITAPTMTIANTRPSSSRIDVTAVSAATNIAYVTMSYNDFEGTGATASIAFQINKSIKGEIGRRAGSNAVYYQISSSTAPSTPTATYYTFSTNTFTGLTANWGTTPPIYSGSNLAKYWYSSYIANEDSSSADRATTAFTSLSFVAPKQSIGFDGLVTFTDNNAVNDNKGNSLSFGLQGATQIIGDNIYTGKIQSTNYSPPTTTVYANRGVEINLDSGSITGPSFFIDSSGSAYFSGTVSASLIQGATIQGGTGDFTGTIISTAGTIGGWTIDTTSISANLDPITPGYIKIDSVEPSIVIASGSSNETVVSISGLDELTPVNAQSIAVTPPSASESRSLLDTSNSSYGPNLSPSITLYQSVTNYSASITNSSQSFTTSTTQSGSYTIRVQLSGSAFASDATIVRNSGVPSITSYTVAGTVGVYIRSGSTANDAATIATLSKAFSTSSLSPGPLTASVAIRNLNTSTYLLTQNVTLKSSTKYFIVPFISTTYTSMLVSGAYGNFISASINQRIYTPEILTSSVQLGVNKIELVAGGFQVVRDAGSYFRARRGGSTDSAASPWLASGGNFKHTGDLTVTGTLSKGGGSFQIPHPLLSKRHSHYLIHSFIEGPKMDLIYRGKVRLADGVASINIDSDSNMTEGTFEVLCRDVQCFTSNETGWAAVKGSVSGNILTIQSENTVSTDTISWMVIAQRKDDYTKTSSITDMYGNLLVEKPIE